LLDEHQAPGVAASMGLLPHEYALLRKELDRPPTHCELAVFSGMWSEHCSYKSTRHLLSTLPRESPRVLAGPGSHAGVVDVGEGWAVAFKIESHNHPSAVEPYQGAATGVGGILRDVIAQGARPCAILDFLCFGDPQTPETRRLKRGIVAGIAGYGNAIGVPNLGGRTHYDRRYEGNPLVNALAAGLIRPDAQRTARAHGAGNFLVLVGATTGRDGILGAAFASADLGGSEERTRSRSHVQVGDPFAGKLLMEAILSFGEEQGLIAVQDLGACGIACAAFEMAAAGETGIDVSLDAVPLREADMSAVEIFLSESQERFAIVVAPERLDAALSHFRAAGVKAAAIGRLTDSGRVRVFHRGTPYVDLPATLVAGRTPKSDWPLAAALPATPAVHETHPAPRGEGLGEMLLRILASPGVSDPEPLYSQYDQTVGNRSVCGPGQATAAVLRLPSSRRGFALTLTGRGDLCAADPYLGAQSALAEALRRLAGVGAELVAITDGLNFASPRDPVEHRRIVEVIRGLGDGLRALDIPVTGGNVSLYNQSPRGPIPPTPMIGALGIVDDVGAVPRAALRPNLSLLLVGALPCSASASHYAALRSEQPSAGTPHVDLAMERRLAALLRTAVSSGHVQAATVAARGGLLVALAKLCLRGGTGAVLTLPACERPDWQLFGEYAAQAWLAVPKEAVQPLLSLGAVHEIPIHHVGESGGGALRLRGLFDLDLSPLSAAYRGAAGSAHAQ
jgi:phosphoribosylformylglycinamidine synthase